MELEKGKTYNYDPSSGTFTRDKGRSLEKGYTKDQRNLMRTEKPDPYIAKKSSKKRNYG